MQLYITWGQGKPRKGGVKGMTGRYGIIFGRRKMASVRWVRKHLEMLGNIGFTAKFINEAERYIREHNLDTHGAGHAAINNVGRQVHPHIRKILANMEHASPSQGEFLNHLRNWFDFEGHLLLAEAIEGQES